MVRVRAVQAGQLHVLRLEQVEQVMIDAGQVRASGAGMSGLQTSR